MRVSTITALTASPSRENSPVSIPKNRMDEAAIRQSDSSRALPTSSDIYFFKIIATISVPPELPPRLNKMALPAAGRKME